MLQWPHVFCYLFTTQQDEIVSEMFFYIYLPNYIFCYVRIFSIKYSTRFFYKQRLFSTKPQCYSTF